MLSASLNKTFLAVQVDNLHKRLLSTGATPRGILPTECFLLNVFLENIFFLNFM